MSNCQSRRTALALLLQESTLTVVPESYQEAIMYEKWTTAFEETLQSLGGNDTQAFLEKLEKASLERITWVF